MGVVGGDDFEFDGSRGVKAIDLEGHVAEGAEADPDFPLGTEGVEAGVRHKRRKGFVEPDAFPPLHGDEVTEPHVSDFVRHHFGDALYFLLRGRRGVDEEGRFAIGHTAQVLHGAEGKVRNRNHVQLVAGIGDSEVVREEAQRKGARFECEGGEMSLAARRDDTKWNSVHVDGFGFFEWSHDEGHQVGRHLHCRPKDHRGGPIALIGATHDGGVGVGLQVTGNVQRDVVAGLKNGLIPAGEGAAGIG